MTEHPTLAEALVAALADITVVEKTRKAKIKTKQGPDYEYEYADITDVIKLTRPALQAHGLVALTPIHAYEGGLACTVRLVHTSGQTMDLGPFPFPHGSTAQATGSLVTYHRRYALVAALGIAAGDDDDGAQATAAAHAPDDRPARPSTDGWSLGAAKNRLLKRVGPENIKQAWIDLSGETRWPDWEQAFPTDEVEAWLAPADPVEDPK